MANYGVGILTASVLLAVSSPGWAIQAAPVGALDRALPAPARAPAAVVDRFHAALTRGDTRGALTLLAADALIFEAGGVERSKAEYAAHHLQADAAFAQAVPGKHHKRFGSAVGDIAWIATEGRTAGTYKNKAVDRLTTETMVLRRAGGSWKIVHIHWSSAAPKK
ncbi:MAG: nuclear transport factor 2 family protein [Sphingomonas sp.]|nr:nuclear transport factor 2 family protein [Sphingomonas sp.]